MGDFLRSWPLQDACRPPGLHSGFGRMTASFGGCLVNRFLSAVVLFSMVGCGSGMEAPTPPTSGPSSLQTEDIVVGTGDTAANGDRLTVHYIGSFLDGRVFQSSYGSTPFDFILGTRAVIAGWDQGLPGMKVGGK